ncbi:MAG: 4a-hydroxytetrahydrobiopterin dehydratase [Candidatus Accumulibacter sp.]|uniref:4a-hydroxytetrahydrobiopterin dehydratase n=2 Tax=Accumulibacter sp. TaxID=2053492 RepID=UPI0025E5B1BD|nr:4a-hydroxytetrahydrobiopterin dehydratase [Accumulibacter sp.]MCM8613218.1 4a-hydroxytetrahydrobiopterin dehydratase [Accumulibacter sp.]MCM8636882.1 4a-hydroxytetrahydrobiopterin dehydratase [Accumulibacter sp.]MCM8638870.1 4a-hydroxytetrahydrobiopterin dehydratase [Accumulibacter sp.]
MSGQQDLAADRCRPLRGTEHAIDPMQATQMLVDLPGWQIDATGVLWKRFGFDRYTGAVLFVNIVAGLAERENHHPDLEVGYGHVIVRYSTHDVGGLSRNDFVCAAKIEALAGI